MTEESFLQYITNNPNEISKLNFEKISIILSEVKQILQKEKILVELKIDENLDEVFIIGDIHGNLNALQTLIKLIKKNNPKYVIFLGDIVDRGPQQLECLITVLSLKIIHPEWIILRGNHETIEMNQAYGFYYDFINRFDDVEKYREILNIYNSLPFCLTINDKILCLHGGIPRNKNFLEQIKGLTNQDLTQEVIEKIGKDLIEILWNDPKPIEGFRGSFRGPGVYDFGEDVFFDFMDEYKLEYLIRAHECFPEGFRWFFDGKLLSVFSAPNYRGPAYGNPGSYALIKNGKIIPRIFD